MQSTFNTLICEDCVQGMGELLDESVQLVFADPPYNIGFDYGDEYDDNLPPDEYLAFSRRWMTQVHRVLHKTGSFWLMIGDEWVADLRILAREIGFHMRSWVVWYYTFGVNSPGKLTRSHAHILYLVKHPKDFVCYPGAIRVPSARTLVYNDKRAAPHGRLPDDTWVLRPQELDQQAFPEFGDTWHIPRIAGTFRQRVAGAPNQVPEQLVARVIRFCSQEGDLVLDPFIGTGTTAAVAKKLGRQYVGFEYSAKFIEAARRRVDAVKVGDPLDGIPAQGSSNGQEEAQDQLPTRQSRRA